MTTDAKAGLWFGFILGAAFALIVVAAALPSDCDSPTEVRVSQEEVPVR